MDTPPLAMEDIVEAERLDALNRFDVIDTPREEAFDRITRLIRNIFDLPVAIVSMIDGHRQWYKAYEGLENREVSRDETFCKYTLQDGAPLVVPDARDDERFAQNPMVTGGPQVRFYAGVPLRANDGHNIGTVCAIGFEPRSFGQREIAILSDLAALAMDVLELRQLASVDPLTGALSRRAFKEQAATALPASPSTSTISSRSTTITATQSATRCWPPPPKPAAASCAAPTFSAAWVARSSR